MGRRFFYFKFMPNELETTGFEFANLKIDLTSKTFNDVIEMRELCCACQNFCPLNI